MKTVALVLVLLVLPAYAKDVTVPEGFVLQNLEASGGQIPKPDGWYYVQTPLHDGYAWTVSRENSATGPFETGYRIQVITDPNPADGKTLKEIGDDFLASKKNDKIVATLPLATDGPFLKRTIEVEEPITDHGKTVVYHIIYTYAWSDRLKAAVITSAGTKSELWSQYENTFQVMNGFRLTGSSLQ